MVYSEPQYLSLIHIFAKVAVEAMGLGSVAQSSNKPTKYPDVVENHWANGYINVATQQGVVIGDDEENFRPDDSISYAEAMTILVRIIGHEPAAESKGGFPTGYIAVSYTHLAVFSLRRPRWSQPRRRWHNSGRAAPFVPYK